MVIKWTITDTTFAQASKFISNLFKYFFGAQWFSSLVQVHLFLLLLLLNVIVDAVTFLFGILLTYSFPHIKLVYLVLFTLFKLYPRNPLVSSLWSLMMCLCFLVHWIHHYLLVVKYLYRKPINKEISRRISWFLKTLHSLNMYTLNNNDKLMIFICY